MKIRLSILVTAALFLTACSGVMDSAQPARQVYLLMPLAGSAAAAANPTGPSLVLSLTSVPGLDTDQIQALSTDAQLTRYANARWPDHLPEVLSSVMQRSLAASGRFSSVQLASGARDDHWMLRLEVEKFYGLRDSAGATTRVVTELSGSIRCDGKSHSFTLSDSVPVDGQRLALVVAAHQQGLNAATTQLLKEISAACS